VFAVGNLYSALPNRPLGARSPISLAGDSSQDSNRSRRLRIAASWEALSHSANKPWWTPVDAPRLATDQKVGGSSPSERAYSSWSEQVSSSPTYSRRHRRDSNRHRPGRGPLKPIPTLVGKLGASAAVPLWHFRQT